MRIFISSEDPGIKNDDVSMELETVARETTVKGLWEVYDPWNNHIRGRDDNVVRDADLFVEVIHPYFGKNFFTGFGHYFGMGDVKAVSWFVWKKVTRMVEKMEDTEKVQDFDLVERLLLSAAVQCASVRVNNGLVSAKRYINEDGYKRAVETLRKQYGYDDMTAMKLAEEATNFARMLTTNGDESILSFVDDAEFFFRDGFVRGIEYLGSYVGDAMGYGYAYACSIFADAGMNPPIELLGFDEDHKNAETVEKV